MVSACYSDPCQDTAEIGTFLSAGDCIQIDVKIFEAPHVSARFLTPWRDKALESSHSETTMEHWTRSAAMAVRIMILIDFPSKKP